MKRPARSVCCSLSLAGDAAAPRCGRGSATRSRAATWPGIPTRSTPSSTAHPVQQGRVARRRHGRRRRMRLQLDAPARRSGAAMRRKRSNGAAARRARERRRQRRRRAQAERARPRAHRGRARAARPRAPAAADSPPTEARSDYRYSRYAEDDLKGEKVAAGGERSRYDIDIHQFRFETGLGDRVGLGIDVAHEAMSGATPWYVTPGRRRRAGPGDDPGHDRGEAHRRAALGQLYLDRGKASLGGGDLVRERLPRLQRAASGGERKFNEKNTTLSGGIGALVGPHHAERHAPVPDPPEQENKQSYNVFLALGQVLGRATIVQTSVKYQFTTGFLSDPYKRALVAGIPETDERPDQRHQLSWLTRFRHHVRRLEGTLHFDYMLYFDDWEHELPHLRAGLVPDAVRPLPARALGALLLAEPGRLLRAVLRRRRAATDCARATIGSRRSARTRTGSRPSPARDLGLNWELDAPRSSAT